jgi:hypothetical protein
VDWIKFKERSSDIFVENEHGRNSKGRSPDILDNNLAFKITGLRPYKNVVGIITTKITGLRPFNSIHLYRSSSDIAV